MAALDKKTGATLWRSKGLTDSAAYSSIVMGDIAGIKIYVNLTGKGIAGVIVGGQALSLLLTLLATPVIYSLFDDAAELVARLRGRHRDPRVPVDLSTVAS